MTQLVELSVIKERAMIEAFLSDAGIRLSDGLTEMLGAAVDGELCGMAGRRDNVIQCVAVSNAARGEGVTNTLVSELFTRIRAAGYDTAFLFTKPANTELFSTLGLYVVAETAEAALMCSRRDGPARWAATLPKATGGIGCIVMNANPFTNGHRYLAEHGAERCDKLYVLVVESDRSRYPYADRLRLVREGTADIPNVIVCGGGPYCISQATFPSYFLKRADDAARVHAALDAKVFATRIAPALHIAVRFVGSEPYDPMTKLYNAALADALAKTDTRLVVVERMTAAGRAVSASNVRQLCDAGDWAAVEALVPPATYAYLQACKR